MQCDLFQWRGRSIGSNMCIPHTVYEKYVAAQVSSGQLEYRSELRLQLFRAKRPLIIAPTLVQCTTGLEAAVAFVLK
jgi:hypothetical protein